MKTPFRSTARLSACHFKGPGESNEDWQVDPDTGDVYDSNGEPAGNLGDEVGGKLGSMTGTIYSVRVALLLFGSGLDPEEISKLLGLEADRSRKKGLALESVSKQQIVSKFGQWGIATKLIDVDVALHGNRAIDIAFGSLKPRLAQIARQLKLLGLPIRNLPNVEQAFFDCFIFETSLKEENCMQVAISSEFLSHACEMELSIRVTMSSDLGTNLDIL